MKHIKAFEDIKLKPEEKEGNKVARRLKNIINKIFYIKDYLELYEVSYNWMLYIKKCYFLSCFFNLFFVSL